MTRMKYNVYWTSFGYYSNRMFPSIEKALEYIKNNCFSGSVIDKEHNVVAYWDPLTGTTYNTSSFLNHTYPVNAHKH